MENPESYGSSETIDAAQTTGRWLELNGHKVEVVIDSKDCLSQLEKFNPDVLLLDIAMPGISGYDLAKKSRRICIAQRINCPRSPKITFSFRRLNMISPVYVDQTVLLTAFERNALQKRLGQIAVALGHPRWTAKQLAALMQERAELESKLASY
jgi:CheY-like chemotaxis protein